MEIALLGEPLLREIAQPIGDITSEILTIADEMLATLEISGGVGLAAPQVFISKRLIIVASKPTQRYPYAPLMPATVMINPNFVALGDEKQKDWEGCLSIKGIRALVPRYQSIQVTYTDLTGQVIETKLEGFVAECFSMNMTILMAWYILDRVENNKDIISEAMFFKLIANK